MTPTARECPTGKVRLAGLRTASAAMAVSALFSGAFAEEGERSAWKRARDRVAVWADAGAAAGHAGDRYNNRDRGHSSIRMKAFPGLEKVSYDKGEKGFGPTVRVREGPVVGNSSTASKHIELGSHIRSLYGRKKGLEGLYQQHRGNNLYVYPEHRDHDPGRGDLIPANTPYLIGSQGSSGSDKPFIRAALLTLAAFKPKVKEKLVATGLLMPTVQRILRRSNPRIESEEAYRSGRAHPSVFRRKQLDPIAMVERAQAMTLETIPPLARLRVVSECPPLDRERDYFDPRSERIADTPCAIARVWRGPQTKRTMVISAKDSLDLRGDPLRFEWRLLRGDPERVELEPTGESGVRVRITAKYPHRRAVRYGRGLASSRIDVACFATDGETWSAPSFVTIYGLPEEKRRYEKGELREIDYTTSPVVDPRLSAVKNWRDVYHYDARGRFAGFTRHRKKQSRRYSAHGLAALRTDDRGRPVLARRVQYRFERKKDPPQLHLHPRIQKEKAYRIRYASPRDGVGKVVGVVDQDQ